jgi:uncharacterized membrane protein HdeD (DUF308 family)
MTSQAVVDLENRIRLAIQEHWKAFLIEGVLLVLLGLGALVVPALASLAVTIFLGWVFLVSGAVGLALTIWARPTPGFWWSLLSALLAIGAGAILLARPAQGTLTLTIILAIYFLLEGIFTIAYALEHRRGLSERWGWMLGSGIVDLILAAVILAKLPGSADWVLGLLVGIDLVFGGGALIGMALAARNAARLRTDCGWGQLPGSV